MWPLQTKNTHGLVFINYLYFVHGILTLNCNMVVAWSLDNGLYREGKYCLKFVVVHNQESVLLSHKIKTKSVKIWKMNYCTFFFEEFFACLFHN